MGSVERELLELVVGSIKWDSGDPTSVEVMRRVNAALREQPEAHTCANPTGGPLCSKCGGDIYLPEARGVVDGLVKLAKKARALQREHYGSGTGLHLDMIDWASEFDALTAMQQPVQEGGVHDWQVASLRYGLGQHADLSRVDDDQLRLVLAAAGMRHTAPCDGTCYRSPAGMCKVCEMAQSAQQPGQAGGGARLTNPWTGEPRDYRDVNSDPAGTLCVEPGAPLKAAPPSAPVGVEGTWLWCKLMDWCREHRIAPATQDKLFAIAGEAHRLNALTQQPAQAAPGVPDGCVLVLRSRIQGLADVLDADGDEWAAATEMREWLATPPGDDAAGVDRLWQWSKK